MSRWTPRVPRPHRFRSEPAPRRPALLPAALALPILVAALVLLSGGGRPYPGPAGPLLTAGLAPLRLTVFAEAAGAPTYRVYATRIGLVGQTTANGHVIQPRDRFAALPSKRALSPRDTARFQVLVKYKGRSVVVPVWDVGPWNRYDNYWDESRDTFADLPRGKPQAQAAFADGYNDGKDERGRPVLSPAGLDLADGTFWDDLGMVQSDWVDVTFLWLDPASSAYNPPRPPSPRERVAEIKNDPNVRYFPETGHNLGYEFRTFWLANGGLDLFGLPITDGVNEDGVVTQYFERARFEYHPEYRDTPYVVQLGALGRALTAGRSFPAAANAASTATVRYFPETGHGLGGSFRSVWEARGGLPIFGYPISEELTEVSPVDGKSYAVQYFERARFEYHPEFRGTPYEVQLGLLGSEMARRKGWGP